MSLCGYSEVCRRVLFFDVLFISRVMVRLCLHVTRLGSILHWDVVTLPIRPAIGDTMSRCNVSLASNRFSVCRTAWRRCRQR